MVSPLELSALDWQDGGTRHFCLSSHFPFRPHQPSTTSSSSTMPRRSPSPDSHKRYRDTDDRDKYRSRRDDTAGYRRSADRESRDDYRDHRGYSEQDTRRSYHDDNDGIADNDRRRRDDGDDRRRRKDGYDAHDDGRQRRDEGDGESSRRGEHRDRGHRDRLRDDRDRHERGDERRDSSRRSASPRRSRPHSRSRSRSPSPSATSPPEDKTKPNFAPSGLLAAATNTVKHRDGTSTLLKYNEPPEARKPLVGWRPYVFKGDEQVGAPAAFFFFPFPPPC